MVDVARTRAELLIIFEDGQLDGSISPQDMRDYVVTTDIVNTRFSTGLITGGEVTINAGDNELFDIAAGEGFFADNFTDPVDPVRTRVSWTAFIGVTVTDIATQPRTSLGLDLSSGSAVIVQQSALFTPAQGRVIIALAGLIHTNQTNLEFVFSGYSCAQDTRKDLEELQRFVRLINPSGNVFGANGANLNLDKSAGETFNNGINYTVDKQSPNLIADPSLAMLTFNYIFQDGSMGFTFGSPTTVIDSEFYDDGSGTLLTMPNNQFQIQRIWFFTLTNQTVIHYGQTTYSSMNDAVVDINAEIVNLAPELTDGFRCWLIVRDGATDLTNAAEVKFIAAGRFGDVLRM